MNDFISGTAAIWIPAATLVIVFGALIFYALRTKGDVTARLSHGLTSFELEAKERPRQKKLE
jgi:hypothetical protein